MNTKGKIAIALAVMMVAAAMAVPAVMGVDYSATVLSEQNTVLTASDGVFGDVQAGSSYSKGMTIQLQNTGNTNATVTAMGEDFSYSGTETFAITNLKINTVAVTTTGAVVVESVPADGVAYDYPGELSIPTGQAGGSYTTAVTLTFENE